MQTVFLSLGHNQTLTPLTVSRQYHRVGADLASASYTVSLSNLEQVCPALLSHQ